MHKRGLRVLVIPEQYPRFQGDIAGIFTQDYVRAICVDSEVHVLVASELEPPGLHPAKHTIAGARTWTFSTRLANSKLPSRLRRLQLLWALGSCKAKLPEVDIIHAHGPVFFGHAALRLGRRLGVPVIVTVHTGPFSKLMERCTVRRLTEKTLRQVNCVLPVSHDLRRQIEAFGILTRRCEVHYNPVDTDLFKPQIGVAREERIAWAGRLEGYKGALRTVIAFEKIMHSHSKWRLVIAGDGPERTSIDAYLRAREELARRVELVGMQSKEQIANLYTKCSFGVFPTEHETFGLVLVEAMAAGLPVIGPNCTAPPEYINDSNGIMIPPGSVEAIATAMEKMILNIGTYDRSHIRENVVERFGISSFGNRMSTLYRDLCGAVR